MPGSSEALASDDVLHFLHLSGPHVRSVQDQVKKDSILNLGLQQHGDAPWHARSERLGQYASGEDG